MVRFTNCDRSASHAPRGRRDDDWTRRRGASQSRGTRQRVPRNPSLDCSNPRPFDNEFTHSGKRRPPEQAELHNLMVMIARYGALEAGISMDTCGWVPASHPQLLQLFHLNQVKHVFAGLGGGINS